MSREEKEAFDAVIEAARRHLENAGMPFQQYGQKALKVVQKYIDKHAK